MKSGIPHCWFTKTMLCRHQYGLKSFSAYLNHSPSLLDLLNVSVCMFMASALVTLYDYCSFKIYAYYCSMLHSLSVGVVIVEVRCTVYVVNKLMVCVLVCVCVR